MKVFPLYTPMTDPIISGTMIMFRRCVLTGSGFSPEAASLLAFRNFLISARGLRLSPLWNLPGMNATLSKYLGDDQKASWSMSEVELSETQAYLTGPMLGLQYSSSQQQAGPTYDASHERHSRD